MSFEKHLPPTHTQAELAALLNAKSSLRLALKKALNECPFQALHLSSKELHALAETLAEFVYDMQNAVGLWSTLEVYNREFFGTPLPFIVQKHKKMNAPLINAYRLAYFLWYQYEHLKPDVLIAPTHKGLKDLAEKLTLFINQHIHLKVKTSSIKTFLDTDNDYAWDVKRKLIWLGKKSYLFRDDYQKYIDENGDGESIAVTDDFICQETTRWSGLGVIDILARLLDIDDPQRIELQSWYERHASVYKLLRVTNDVQIGENIVTKARYTIRTNQIIRGMETGAFIYGSLVPWKNEWAWSGAQHILGHNLYADYLQELVSDFKKRSAIVYRYAKDLLQQAEEHNQKYYSEFVDYFGDELVAFPDGYKMAAAVQGLSQQQFAQLSPHELKEMQHKHALQNPWSNFKFPQDLLENDAGVGLFFEKSQGIQMMTFFDDLQSGLDKRGAGLNEDELEALRGFITSPTISPAFVKKVATGQKIRSIKEAFLLRHDDDDLVLNFLFRKYKGSYFRKYYPNLGII
jgi:hypothetical protein